MERTDQPSARACLPVHLCTRCPSLVALFAFAFFLSECNRVVDAALEIFSS